jgi:hypothetical protein
VSTSNLGAVRKYIEGQEEHHRKRTFNEEYTLLLGRNGFSLEETSSYFKPTAAANPGLHPGL